MDWVDPLGLSQCPMAKLDERGFTGVIRSENGGMDYAESNALYSNPERLKPDGTAASPIVKIDYTVDYQSDFEAASIKGFGQKSVVA